MRFVQKRVKGAFLYASNFSLRGEYHLSKSIKQLAKIDEVALNHNIMLEIEEIHHTQKLDAPSGTAISLANGIISQHPGYNNWKLDESGQAIIPIIAKRIEDVPGTHTVNYESEVDSITIEHVAHTRQGFALGAVIAAEWIAGKTGVFTMNDVLNIG